SRLFFVTPSSRMLLAFLIVLRLLYRSRLTCLPGARPILGISTTTQLNYSSPCRQVVLLPLCQRRGKGGVSAKELTLKSGLLNNVKEGDVYLVDRGFRCEEMFAAKGAKLLIPAFTKGKKQLSGAEVTLSRKLSRARIHVERAIRRLKVFR
ncbi:unnamed protein product, partial [Ixodes persulcatus]